jgi:hypothetical protein
MLEWCAAYQIFSAQLQRVWVVMTHLLAILASPSAWFSTITRESFIIPCHSFSALVFLLCIPNSRSSIYYNIVVKIILQIRPRWMNEREVDLTILPYRPRTQVQHSNGLQYREHECFLQRDITHMEIHISPTSITIVNKNPWNSAITLKVSNQLCSADSKCCINSMPCGYLKSSNIHA